MIRLKQYYCSQCSRTRVIKIDTEKSPRENFPDSAGACVCSGEFIFSAGMTQSEKPKGSWIIYGYDTMAYPIAIFAEEDELKARQFRDKIGYGEVKFWEFGTDWFETIKGG